MGSSGGLEALFLQVRLDSTRLYRKALLPLGGKTVVEQVMEALRLVPVDLYVLLTDEKSSKELEPLARGSGFNLFVGSKEDVLNRFAEGVRFYKPVTVVRTTGDNPLVSWEMAKKTLALHRESNFDLTTLTGLPLGSGVEVVKGSALLAADLSARDPYEREHVTPYLYRHPEIFSLQKLPAPEELQFPEGRITLDTAEDYACLKEMFARLYKGTPPTLQETVEYLREKHG